MAESVKGTKKRRTKKEVLTVSFGDGALEKIKELAILLGIGQDNLTEVLVKGIKIIDFAKDGKLIVEKGNERLEIDLKKV